MKRGLLINNIGTPSELTRESVKAYLDEFLMDPNVIGAPFPIRWLFVKGLITPRRAPASLAKYAKVWTPNGSPLLTLTRDFARGVSSRLGPEWAVEIGMRYGTPSIAGALRKLREKGAQEIVFAPMYPQYARSSTASAVEELNRAREEMNWKVPVRTIAPFHGDEGFLGAQAAAIRPYLDGAEHLVFSFHGLPESHLKRVEGCVVTPGCCDRVNACALNCYRAQSLRTAADLARALNRPNGTWTASFQSRLGPAKWTGPSTVDTVRHLAEQGVKKLVIAVPSFTTDCLETLEEVGLELRDEFLKAGGTTFRRVPCLNASEDWVEAFSVLAERSARPATAG